jgi:hypothetical protein
VVLDIAPRKIQHVKGKLSHKLGLAKLLLDAKRAQVANVGYALC